MANNEDVFIEKDGKITILTEKTSATTSGTVGEETITIPELTEVSRAMIAPIAGTSGTGAGMSGTIPTPILMSGRCSGNAVRIGWTRSGYDQPVSGDPIGASGSLVTILAVGH